MPSVSLSDSKVRSILPKQSSYYVWNASSIRGAGRIGVKVYPTGRKTFVYRYYLNGKEKFVTLGDYPQISLAAAVKMGSELAEKVKLPIEITKQKATLSQLFDGYIENQIATGKRSYEKTRNRLNQVLSCGHVTGEIPASEVTPNHIKLVLASFIKRGAVAGSNKVRAALHAVFNFGLFADNDPAKITNDTIYGLTTNPVSVVPKQNVGSEALDRFLTWEEVKSLIDECSKTEQHNFFPFNFSKLILLCLYTCGQRPWELMANTKSNIDLNNNTLTVPPHLSKTKDYHVIPLSESALKILNSIDNNSSDYIFPADTDEGHVLPSEFAKQVRKFCLNKGFEKFTPRDIRRTFKTLAGEMGISSELRDMLQNHKRAGVSAKHYDRYGYLKEKREVVKQWEEKLLSL